MENYTQIYKNNNLSVLINIKENEHYDFILMGTSHAKAFSVFQTHQLIEQNIGKKFFPMGYNAGGPLLQKMYLTYFYDEKNTASKIIYLIDPWVLYSKQWNEVNYYPADEVFRPKFVKLMIENNMDNEVIREYLRHKVTYHLFTRKEAKFADSKIDENYVKNSKAVYDFKISQWYAEGQDKNTFEKYSKELEQIIAMAKKNNTEVIFMLPPNLMHELPGQKELILKMKYFEKKYGIKFYDYSETVHDPKYYNSLDHLNLAGVLMFSKQYLLPILNNSR